MNVSRKITYFLKYFVAIALSLLFSQTAFTQSSLNQRIAIEGSLTDTGGNAIDLSGAALIFYVMNDNNCYLYGEWSSTAGDAQGNITHRLGGGTKVVGSPNDFTQSLFFGAASGKNISNDSACAVAAADTRIVQVYYQAQNIRANIQLGTVPYAHNATTLNGKNSADFLQVTPDSNVLFFSGSDGQVLTKQADGSLNWKTPTVASAASVTSSSITAALGYTPVASTSFTAVSTSVNNHSTSITALQTAVSGITSSQWQTVANGIAYVGSVGIGTNSPSTSAILDLRNGSGKAFVLPQMTTAQRNAITTPVLGTILYNTDTNRINSYTYITTVSGSVSTTALGWEGDNDNQDDYSRIARGDLVSGALVVNNTAGIVNNNGQLLLAGNTPTASGAAVIIDNFSSNVLALNVNGHSAFNGTMTVSATTGEIARFSSSAVGGYISLYKSNVPMGFMGYSTGSFTIFNNELASGGVVIGSQSGGVQFGSNGVAHVTMTSDGRVGIGTTTPAFKLTLSGTTTTDRKIGINGVPVVYLPDQTNFQGSLFIGDGGGSLTHATAAEGTQNTAIGMGALNRNTTGYVNTANGYYALFNNTTGVANSAYGAYSLSNNTTGSFNTAYGHSALNLNTTGSYNIAIGRGAGSSITTGNNNVIIGSNNGDTIASATNNILIADGAGNERIRVNSSGYVGIGTTAPRVPFEISANGSGSSWSNVAAFTGYAGGSGFSGSLVLRSYRDGGSSVNRRSAIQSVDQDFINDIPSAAPTDLILQPDGSKVGIGTTAPAYKLDINGDLRVAGQSYTNSGSSMFTVLSDVRYKDVHGPYERGLNELLKIGTIRFNYKKENPTGADPNHEYVGVAAQNVKENIPEAVETREINGKEFLSVNPTPMIYAMINAIKELYFDSTAKDRKIQSLEEQNAAQAKELEDVKARLERIEKSLNSK